MEHTKTPWVAFKPHDDLITVASSLDPESKGSVIARITNLISEKPLTPEDEANAEFIVRACNAYGGLVARLEQTLAYLEHPDVVGMGFAKCSSVMAEQVREVLAEATA